MKKIKNQGFTLLEILAVISIVIVLLGLVIGLAGVVTQKASEAKAQEDLEKIRQIVDDYKFQHGVYPINLTEAIETAIIQRHAPESPPEQRAEKIKEYHKEMQLKFDPWGSSYTSNYEKEPPPLQYIYGSMGRDNAPGFRGENDDKLGKVDDRQELGFGDDITNIR